VLGDVIVSDGVVQYGLGRRLPEEFGVKDTLQDALGRLNDEIRARLAKLSSKDSGTTSEKWSYTLRELIRSLEGSSPAVSRAVWVIDSGTDGAVRPPPNNGIAELEAVVREGSCESRYETVVQARPLRGRGHAGASSHDTGEALLRVQNNDRTPCSDTSSCVDGMSKVCTRTLSAATPTVRGQARRQRG
jgi:hypothetical protein